MRATPEEPKTNNRTGTANSRLASSLLQACGFLKCAAAKTLRALPFSGLLISLLLLCVSPRTEAALQDEVRINAGGAQYTDSKGQTWGADQFFSGGFPYTTAQPISGTTSQPLFQTERSGAFSYKIPVPPGRVRVTLYFAEI